MAASLDDDVTRKQPASRQLRNVRCVFFFEAKSAAVTQCGKHVDFVEAVRARVCVCVVTARLLMFQLQPHPTKRLFLGPQQKIWFLGFDAVAFSLAAFVLLRDLSRKNA